MNLDDIKKRINNYLNSDKRWPIIVDLQTRNELAEIKDFFSVGENKFITAEKFCGNDGTFKDEEFIENLSNSTGISFYTELTGFLKLQGEAIAKKIFKSIVQKDINGHVVILTYQCKNLLRFSDPRIIETGRVIILNSEPDEITKICLISPYLSSAFKNVYMGFEKISYAIETENAEETYIATDVEKAIYENSLFNLNYIDNSYEILCSRDSKTKKLPKNLGTEEQWNYVLSEFDESKDWNYIIDSIFGSCLSLENDIGKYLSFDKNKQWLYFVALSLFGCGKKEYLQFALQNSEDFNSFIKSIYRTILNFDFENKNFDKYYQERKEILKELSDTEIYASEYCKVLSIKEKDQIYYLTDLSQQEKEKIIAWIDTYGKDFSKDELIKILENIYPDLVYYLSKFNYNNNLLDNYFENYKYQKITNKILPEFESVVKQQAQNFDFVSCLKARATIIDKLDLSSSCAYFVDALGVEYLSFIQNKCNQYGLSANINCGRCELPSLTCFNKEFMEVFEANKCPVISIKTLDEIKHHGENNFDYEKVKIPIYLIKELEILDELLKKIKMKLINGEYKKAVIVSDHGASRLAVIHETENIWQMETSGVNSGRCCPKNEINDKPDFAIEAENYWVLANYDRFKGSRKANCEVHGGATLEEVAVPIIEITQKSDSVEAFIPDDYKVITLAAKEEPCIKIYVGLKSNNISVRVNDEIYIAETSTEDYLYIVNLHGLTRKGEYLMDIYDGNDLIISNQKFEIKKKGMSVNNLFG